MIVQMIIQMIIQMSHYLSVEGPNVIVISLVLLIQPHYAQLEKKHFDATGIKPLPAALKVRALFWYIST